MGQRAAQGAQEMVRHNHEVLHARGVDVAVAQHAVRKQRRAAQRAEARPKPRVQDLLQLVAQLEQIRRVRLRSSTKCAASARAEERHHGRA